MDVHLPSGVGYSVEVSPETPVSELKAAAQQHFRRRLLLTAKGQQLDLTATLCEAGLRDGDEVTAVVQLGKLGASNTAFAWHRHGGEVVTWGFPEFRGDSSEVQEQLRNVQATQLLLLPFLNQGQHPASGGDSSEVQDRLRNAQSIQATAGGFAAILESGAAVTWGSPAFGGDSSQVQEQLRNVRQIQATDAGAFAAILSLGLL